MKEKNIYENICEETGLAYAYVYETLCMLPLINGYQYCRSVQKIYEMSLFNANLARSMQELVNKDKRILGMIKLHEYGQSKLMPGMTIEQAEVILNEQYAHAVYMITRNRECYVLCKYRMKKSLERECIAVSRSLDDIIHKYDTQKETVLQGHEDDLKKLGIDLIDTKQYRQTRL